MEFVEGDEDLLRSVVDPMYPSRPERVLVFHVNAWAVNYNQHIQPRFTEEELPNLVGDYQRKIENLERVNENVRPQLRELSAA